MACAKCDFYMPKESTAALMFEGKTHLLRLLQEIPLGEAEHAAVEEGVAAYEKLLLETSGCANASWPNSAADRRHFGANFIEIRPAVSASIGGLSKE